jgi:hypothetical protein
MNVLTKGLLRGALVVGGVGVGLVMVELCLRFSAPHEGFGAARELRQFRTGSGLEDLYELDAVFGFRPRLGTSLYDEWGVLCNPYSRQKAAGVKRLLFMGDSVTARGAIVNGLREAMGQERCEFWNAGVESFNTVQEVEFFRRYNAAAEPDHVILTFHINDFETTPVAFRDEQGRLVVFAPNFPRHYVNERLFKSLRTYRLFLGLARRSDRNLDAVLSETRSAVALLQGELRERGIGLSVLLFPLLKPRPEWTEGEERTYQSAVKMFSDLGIETQDLRPWVEQAAGKGIPVRESPLDDWHPSAECGRFIARQLVADGRLGFLAAEPVPSAPASRSP